MFGPMSVRMAFPFDLLVRSLCPSIIGHDMVKAGILLGLLGGTPPSSSGLEEVRSGVSIRSNIHCLVVGDPGMGKSCLLLATTSVAARSVYVGGNTSTTTGLTVSLSKEPGGEIGIEAGALVLADQGVCCIDEFDKMAKSNQDGKNDAVYYLKCELLFFLTSYLLLLTQGSLKQWNSSKYPSQRLALLRHCQLGAVLLQQPIQNKGNTT